MEFSEKWQKNQLRIRIAILSVKNAVFCIKKNRLQRNAKNGAKRTIAAIWKLQSMLLNSKMPKDPICGMEVDEKKAKFRLASKGKKYFFCSKNCYDKFSHQGKATILKKTTKKHPIENKKNKLIKNTRTKSGTNSVGND